jgi:HK97 family phage major capsid protein
MEQNISKNRAANELRAKARAVMAEIEDTTKPLTTEEFDAKKKEFDVLTARAQFLAGHTPEAEIERQGGEGDLVRVENVQDSDVTPPTLTGKIEELQKQIREAFGGTANYLRHANKTKFGSLTAKQLRVMENARELTKHFTAEDATTRTIVGTASDASGGEFLLPLQQVESIFQVDNTIPGLLQRARLYSMRGRTLRIPYLDQTNEDLTRPLSGIAAITIVGEAAAKPVREPSFGQRLLTAYKYAAISQFSDEMLDDDMTGDIDNTVVRVVGQEILNQLNFDITINGSNSSAPFGALHTSATHASGNTPLLKVTRASQNQITFADAVNMYVQHTHGPNSFWLISRRAIGELFTFELSTGSGATYLANLRQDPSNTPLLGYPIVISDFMNALGSEGDFALVNPDHYAAALRKQLTVESSIHYAFVNDVTTWRFFARGGGVPIPDAPYAYRSVASNNVDEHSPFVVLDDAYAA